MTVENILEFTDTFAPFETAEEFDNCGLLVGDKNDEVNAVGLSLDITNDIIDKAIDAKINLIITHHPVIFDPIKSVCADSVVYRLIKNNISVISAHTNLDKSDLGTNAVLKDALNLENVSSPECFDGMGRLGTLPAPLAAEEYARLIKANLSASGVRYYDCGKPVSKVAYVSGSGGSFLESAAMLGIDTFITGDIKHDVFVLAQNININLIEAQHFDAENLVMYSLLKLFKAQFGDIQTTVLSTENKIKTI